MIEARIDTRTGKLAARLAAKAVRLASARTAQRRKDSWRHADLLWPLFTKDHD